MEVMNKDVKTPKDLCSNQGSATPTYVLKVLDSCCVKTAVCSIRMLIEINKGISLQLNLLTMKATKTTI